MDSLGHVKCVKFFNTNFLTVKLHKFSLNLPSHCRTDLLFRTNCDVSSYNDKRVGERQALRTSLRLENPNVYIYELINLGRTFNRKTIDPFYRALSIVFSCAAEM